MIAPRATRLYERNVVRYRRGWMIILSGFFEPVFYLVAMRVGFSDLIGGIAFDGRTIPYSDFVAPALLASSAMNGAVYESTMNIYFKLKEQKLYDAVLATPVGPADIAVGEIAWCLTRGSLYAVGFFAVALALGVVSSWWGVLLVPAAVLIGYAFAGVGMAFTSYMRGWQDFDIVQIAVLPMFLLSATFYPLSTYPEALQWVVRCTPLYQGVDLCRSLALGSVGWDLLGHALYLVAMGSIGLTIATRRLGRLLLA
jgi:lipooligosaccharide transport system permease protein